MTAPERDYSETLFLPQTDFPMRAGLPQREPELLKRWASQDIYQAMRAKAKGRPKFILHDGPPYANGNIHIGTALNKILKDVVTRGQQMLGFDSNYVPGWDCHGLPIEWKIEEENYRSKGKPKPDLKNSAAMIAFRQECRAYAEHWLNVQREEFKRLGVEGDWSHPYTTMSFPAEAQIARELMKFAANGTLYRGSKPVMWSVVEKTALAEAEVEYEDYHSETVWVKFPIRKLRVPANFILDIEGSSVGTSKASDQINEESKRLLKESGLDGASIIIWTTTPWTLPGNRAISFSSKITYELYRVDAVQNGSRVAVGDKFVLAKNLRSSFIHDAKIEQLWTEREIPSSLLHDLVCSHPLSNWTGSVTGASRNTSGYTFDVPLLEGDHVTDEAGTGFVHTAPGHGREDFEVWMSYAPELEQAYDIRTTIPYTVDENGAFTSQAPGFTGLRVINDEGEKGEAIEAVIDALKHEKMLVARRRLKHQYPHSWRSKKPVIFRNTPQWFIAMDRDIRGGANDATWNQSAGRSENYFQSLNADHPPSERWDTIRKRALHAIKATAWVPPQGENRITGMIEARPDWVISRQRAWGVPIAVFVKENEDGSAEVLKDDAVNMRIGEAFEKEGADAWYKEGARERFLGSRANEPWQKVDDILDVWFDSGSTHAFVLEDPKHFPQFGAIKRKADGGPDTVMYLEGSDQHRGWFHSSLLESCGTRGRAPFDTVLTHGFVMAEDGRKMSKSLGNVVVPQDVIKQSGADILRMWVCASDYSDDLRIGPEILKSTADTYRKLRNTIRWMLGSLAHFREDERVAPDKMPELERLMLHRLFELDAQVRKAYEEFDYKRVFAALSVFLTSDLSAFYFDIRKDALYCDPQSSVTRKAALTVIDHLFKCTVTWLAPVLCFTAEESWMARYGADAESVHLQLFPDVPSSWRDEALAEKWRKVRNVRRVVTGALEIERAQKRIGSSLEAHPVVHVSNRELYEAVIDVDLAEVCITSAATLVEGEGAKDAFRLDDVAGVAVVTQRAEGKKCARSWKITNDVGADLQFPDVTPRDAQALREWDTMKKAAG